MKINSREFRVPEGEEVELKKWPTLADPFYCYTASSIASLNT